MDKTDFLCSNRRECFGLATRAEILVQIWLARRSYKVRRHWQPCRSPSISSLRCSLPNTPDPPPGYRVYTLVTAKWLRSTILGSIWPSMSSVRRYSPDPIIVCKCSAHPIGKKWMMHTLRKDIWTLVFLVRGT